VHGGYAILARVPGWEDLRYFLAVARAGSLTGAGRTLGVQHTTVARRVTQLEEELGVVLIARTPDGVRLTAAGEIAREHAQAIEAQIAALELAVGGADQKAEGVVRITLSEGFSGFVARRLAPLKAEHPKLDIQLLTSNRTYDLARGEADIAIRMAPTKDPDLKVRKLAESAWSVYAAKGYIAEHGAPRSLEELGAHALIGFDESIQNICGAVWLRERGLEQRVVLRTNSIPAALNAAVGAVGIALLPCMTAGDEPTLVQVLDEVLTSRPIWLVTHPDVARAGRVRVVLDFIVGLIESERGLIEGTARPARRDAT
jgi:DNA-binding transcriptional LysR family regulator